MLVMCSDEALEVCKKFIWDRIVNIVHLLHVCSNFQLLTCKYSPTFLVGKLNRPNSLTSKPLNYDKTTYPKPNVWLYSTSATDYANQKPRSKLHYVRSKQSQPQDDSAYVKVESTIPKHSDTTFEFYADSTIDVQINNYNGTALIDSGATMSVIDSRLVASLIPNAKAHMAKYIQQCSGITSVTGHRSPIIRVPPLLIKIGKFVFEHMTHVIPNLGTQMILWRFFYKHINTLSTLTTTA